MVFPVWADHSQTGKNELESRAHRSLLDLDTNECGHAVELFFVAVYGSFALFYRDQRIWRHLPYSLLSVMKEAWLPPVTGEFYDLFCSEWWSTLAILAYCSLINNHLPSLRHWCSSGIDVNHPGMNQAMFRSMAWFPPAIIPSLRVKGRSISQQTSDGRPYTPELSTETT